MESLAQSEEWKKLGLSLTAVFEGDSWTIKVRLVDGTKGHISFKARTRLDHGQLDPYDAFVGLCETFAGMPQETGEDAYQIWLSYSGFPNTDSYRQRFKQLVDQKHATADVLGLDTIYAVAGLRPASERKRVLPTASAGMGSANLRPASGVQMP